MTTFDVLGSRIAARYRSAPVPVDQVITLHDADGGATLDPELPHGFVGIELLTVADGQEPAAAVATAGTFTVEVKTTVNPGVFEGFPDNEIDCAAPETTGWDGNVTEVRATPAGITGAATHYRLLVTLNAH